MNAVNENDLELLETYLDGELPEVEANALRRRLGEEPAMACAMEEISRDRQLRHEALLTMESGSAAMGATISSALHAAAVREVVWSSRLKIVRQVSAIAACLLVGISVGWFARSNASDSRTTSRQPVEHFSSNPAITPVSFDDRHPGKGFNVAITDDFGRVLAQQHFGTLNEARAFSNDLLQWQTRQRQVRNGDIRLVGDDF